MKTRKRANHWFYRRMRRVTILDRVNAWQFRRLDRNLRRTAVYGMKKV